jgi:hypothetical protein
MNKKSTMLVLAGCISGAFITPTQTNSLQVSATLNKLTTGPLLGTTFDTYKVKIQTAGNFTVDVMAYEASQSNIATLGYNASDLNGDGELTWLDPDTYFYHDNGTATLSTPDAIVRCDDVANNCNSPSNTYINGYTATNSPIVTATHLQTETSVDGSIHFRRDPWYYVTAAAGDYLFLMADFRLDPAEAVGGINGFGGTPDSFSSPTGFVGGITDHADYRVTFSSETLNFALDGNTITFSQVPLPGAIWLFGSALAG